MVTIFDWQVMGKIIKAAKGYEKWKSKHNPHYKPWIYPEQIDLPRIQMNQIKSIDEQINATVIDETNIKESDKEELNGKNGENSDSASISSSADADVWEIELRLEAEHFSTNLLLY